MFIKKKKVTQWQLKGNTADFLIWLPQFSTLFGVIRLQVVHWETCMSLLSGCTHGWKFTRGGPLVVVSTSGPTRVCKRRLTSSCGGAKAQEISSFHISTVLLPSPSQYKVMENVFFSPRVSCDGVIPQFGDHVKSTTRSYIRTRSLLASA